MEQKMLENYVEAMINQREYAILINFLKLEIENNSYIDSKDLKKILISLGVKFE